MHPSAERSSSQLVQCSLPIMAIFWCTITCKSGRYVKSGQSHSRADQGNEKCRNTLLLLDLRVREPCLANPGSHHAGKLDLKIPQASHGSFTDSPGTFYCIIRYPLCLLSPPLCLLLSSKVAWAPCHVSHAVILAPSAGAS